MEINNEYHQIQRFRLCEVGTSLLTLSHQPNDDGKAPTGSLRLSCCGMNKQNDMTCKQRNNDQIPDSPWQVVASAPLTYSRTIKTIWSLSTTIAHQQPLGLHCYCTTGLHYPQSDGAAEMSGSGAKLSYRTMSLLLTTSDHKPSC